MNRDDSHAISNARGWSKTIEQLVAALEVDYERLEELRDEGSDLTYNLERLATTADEKADCEQALSKWDEENGEELRELEDIVSAHDKNYPFKDADDARERIEESPLSVEVRGDWYTPGGDGDSGKPAEFQILLSTGGPALRIRGELDEHCQPRRAWLEYQDWGAPWTEFHGEGAPSQATLVTFCSVFYFGG